MTGRESPSPAGRHGTRAPLAAAACVLALLVAAAGPPPTPTPTPASDQTALSFEKDVRPALAGRCFQCHGGGKHKGGVDLSRVTNEQSAARQGKLWRRVAQQLEDRDMPPSGQPPLTDSERERILRWTHQALARPSTGERIPGRSPVRRLSRSEYNHTLRDLLGVDFDAGDAVGMTDEPSGQTFANQADALDLPPLLMEKYFAAADLALDRLLAAGSAKPAGKVAAGADRRAYDALFIARPSAGLNGREAARRVIARFARRAYRRPVEDREIESLLHLHDLAAARGESFDGAVRLMLKAVLVSPHFLFRLEQDRAPPGSTAPYRVSDHELAVRLSYFLWSSMPDDQLSALADQGKLSDPAVLEQQVRRMLADPRARALTDDFGAHWLQLGKLAEARPSTEFFPTFTPAVRQAMHDETATFFDGLRAEDRSVLDLLDSDYTYLNEDLAKHYGITGVQGPQLRRVNLKPEDHRGGLLGMGSVLALTSHVSRTSPTLRGKWVLEVVFGTPPPPPPPDAGKLDESKAHGKDPKTFRDLMALHASRASCAACHARIDPLGYGLENYDAVGRWRDTAGGQPVDNTGQLPGGQKFTGPAGLKQVLHSRQDEFVRNLAAQVLSYALGRPIDEGDEAAVNEVKAGLARDGYRFSALVMGVVNSYPFQYRRNADVPGEDEGTETHSGEKP